MTAIFTDIHFGIHGNSDDYFEVCSKFVDFFTKYVKTNKIEHVVFAGDWFDSRNTINAKILYGATKCMKKIASCCDTFDMIVGNHDTYEKSSLIPNSVDIYNGLDKRVRVHSKPFTMEYDGGKKILLMPWLVGGNAALDSDDFKNIETGYDLVVGHFDFGNKFFQSSYETSNSLMKVDPFKEELGFTGFIDRILKPDGIVLTGHIHNREEKRCANRRMIIAGSPYETASGFNTSCGFYVYNEQTGDIEYVENPNYPKHVVVKASEIKDGRVDIGSLSGKVVSFEIDCKCSMEEAAEFQSKIALAKPFSYKQNSFSIKLTEDDKKKIEDAGGNLTSKSKFDYVVEAIDMIDPSTYSEYGITKEHLVEEAKRFFESSMEVVNKKKGLA